MSEAARDGPETAKRAGLVMAEEEEEAPAALLLEELEEDDAELRARHGEGAWPAGGSLAGPCLKRDTEALSA